jgi:hypothetical protein
MADEKKKKSQVKSDKKRKKPQEPLPFCKTAPSAEHARGKQEEEPCDDYREGK